jgi:hypothetical protein
MEEIPVSEPSGTLPGPASRLPTPPETAGGPPGPPPPPSGHEPSRDDITPPERAFTEGTSITRYPSLQPLCQTTPGSIFILQVDLLREIPEAAKDTEILQVGGLPQEWRELPVRVHVQSPIVDFIHDEGVVLVQRDADSVPCIFTGNIRTDEGSRSSGIEIVATFFVRDRFCVSKRSSFSFCDSSVNESSRSGSSLTRTSGASEPEQEGAPFDPAAPAADLTVSIFMLSDSCKQLGHLHGLKLRELRLATKGESEIANPLAFVKALFAACSGEANPRLILEGIGEKLYERAPSCFKEAYWRLRDCLGSRFSIQFIVDEPVIPWEFMRPFRSLASEGTGEDNVPASVLAFGHPVGRWLA